MTNVEITTGARLHFGPLSVDAPAGGKFGGVGLMVDHPRVVISVRLAEADSIRADAQIASRLRDFLQKIRQSLPDGVLPPCEIAVTESIPSHCGFGSGTQLGLAVARAVSALINEVDPGLERLSRRVSRGLRSAIGLHGFERGGFLVDGGRPESSRFGTLVARVDFPADWRIVLAAPRKRIGLSGEAEQSAFAKQPPMPTSTTGELCRIVLMDWLPSVIEADFVRCSQSMFLFGHAVGTFFSAAQGGVFADSRMSEWVDVLRRRGVHGVAQTSWGPTVVALCESDSAARQVHRDFAEDPIWSDCSFDVVSPLNQGAKVRVFE